MPALPPIPDHSLPCAKCHSGIAHGNKPDHTDVPIVPARACSLDGGFPTLPRP